jgi:hypothetical protein
MTSSGTYRAIAWRTGAIDLHNGRTPKGAIKLFTFRSRRAAVVANRVLETCARHAYDGKTLLVPGVPEAQSDDAALDALIGWCRRVQPALARRLPARSFRSEVRA